MTRTSPGATELSALAAIAAAARASFGEYIERPSYISPPDATSNHVIGGMGVATTPSGFSRSSTRSSGARSSAEHPSTSRPS